jgi:hypothetical protein
LVHVNAATLSNSLFSLDFPFLAQSMLLSLRHIAASDRRDQAGIARQKRAIKGLFL